MKNRSVNIKAIAKVAKALAELNEQMVFVGGAVTGMYADMAADLELRETFDIDITSISLINYSEFTQFMGRLSQLGFLPNPEGHAICSLSYKGIAVDVMPSDDGPIGPVNMWYKMGFGDIWTRQVLDVEIRILPAPAYLASKFEAFHGRGADYRTSHDFEDIIFVMDNRSSIIEEIIDSEPEIRQYLKGEFVKISENKYREELLSAHLDPHSKEERYLRLLEKVNKILKLEL